LCGIFRFPNVSPFGDVSVDLSRGPSNTSRSGTSPSRFSVLAAASPPGLRRVNSCVSSVEASVPRATLPLDLSPMWPSTHSYYPRPCRQNSPLQCDKPSFALPCPAHRRPRLGAHCRHNLLELRFIGFRQHPLPRPPFSFPRLESIQGFQALFARFDSRTMCSRDGCSSLPFLPLGSRFLYSFEATSRPGFAPAQRGGFFVLFGWGGFFCCPLLVFLTYIVLFPTP